jgi:UDP-glucuronate 4-epimerase
MSINDITNHSSGKKEQSPKDDINNDDKKDKTEDDTWKEHPLDSENDSTKKSEDDDKESKQEKNNKQQQGFWSSLFSSTFCCINAKKKEFSYPNKNGNASFTEEYCKCVLVTGGVGFVGSHIAEALLKEGRKVVIYDIFNSETTVSSEKKRTADILRKTAQQFATIGATISIVHGDIRDKTKIIETVQKFGVTGAIHMGGMVDDRRSVIHPEEYIDINIRGTTILLDALGKCGVKMVVQASTRSVFGERIDNTVKLYESSERRPVNPYGATKVAADAMAHCYSHLHGMNISLVRIFSTYGPRGRPDMIPRILIENIMNDKPIRKFGNGDATRTWVYISDIVSAFMVALKNPQGGFAEFNTGAPNSTTLNKMIECAEEVTGKKAIIEQCLVPLGDAHAVGIPSYQHIKKVLGWVPKVDVKEGMRLTYEDYMENHMSEC